MLFSRKDNKKKAPEKTPRWFVWLMGLFVLYALVASIFSNKNLSESPLPKIAEQSKTQINFSPLFEAKWGNEPAPFYVQTIVEGKGKSAACWDTLLLRYSLYNAKQELIEDHMHDASPTSVTLGQKQIPPGFERGLIGMKEGETRHITARASQAYAGTGFEHSKMRANDVAGWVVTLENTHLPALPTTIGFGYRQFEEKEGKGKLLQCTDNAHVLVSAYNLQGAPLWEKPWDISFNIGEGKEPFGIERAVNGMRVQGKRTIILPTYYMKPLHEKDSDASLSLQKLPENPNELLLLDIEALP